MRQERSTRESIGDLIPLEKEFVRAIDVARELGLSKETMYDWKYRAKKRQIPEGMFIKLGRMLFINTKILRVWLNSQSTIY